jgi:acyl-CoA synthetase (AMP-forming)/AMP-acid ligase II
MNEVKISEEGEICVKSPAKALGYLQGGRITELEEWLHTGDLGYIDEEGYVHISGRKKDIIIRNGNNISSAKIESELLKLKYVENAAVVCGRDEKAGEVPCALVESGRSPNGSGNHKGFARKSDEDRTAVEDKICERIAVDDDGKDG